MTHFIYPTPESWVTLDKEWKVPRWQQTGHFMIQDCEDKHLCAIAERFWRRVYLNYAGVACGCLWVDRESIRLENHSRWGEHSPKTTHKERDRERWKMGEQMGGKGKSWYAHTRGRQSGWGGRRRKNPNRRKSGDPKGWGKKKVKTQFKLAEIVKVRKSTKQQTSCPEKTGSRALKEKASELLCVHQSIMESDRQKHMLRVPFQELYK